MRTRAAGWKRRREAIKGLEWYKTSVDMQIQQAVKEEVRQEVVVVEVGARDGGKAGWMGVARPIK